MQSLCHSHCVTPNTLPHFCRWLAGCSLEFLRKAMPSAAKTYPPLFSEEVFGSIVGMFELNNLSLSIPTPIEDYFLLIDGLPKVRLCVCSANQMRAVLRAGFNSLFCCLFTG